MKKTMQRMAMVALVAGAMSVGVAIQGVAQQSQRGSLPSYVGQQTLPKPGAQPRDTQGIPGIGKDSDTDGMLDRLQQQQAKSRNSERQKKLQTDTERLLSLATELKEQVDKTDKNILSVDVIKKAEEIEKLAHSVKEKMKG